MQSRIQKMMLLLAISISSKAYADTLSDPLNIVSFDTESATFELAPEEINQALELECGRCWIFASYDDDEAKSKYALIFGLRRTDLPKPEESDDMDRLAGTFAYFDGAHWRGLGLPDTFASSWHNLPDRVVLGLARDGVARLIRVYGGKDTLQKKITETWKHFDGMAQVDPVTVTALQEVGITNARVSDENKRAPDKKW